MTIFYAACIITLLFYWFPSFRFKRNRLVIFNIILFVTLLFFGTMRFDVGTDFMNYYNHFIRGEFFVGKYEPGYSFLNYVIKTQWDNPQALIITTHFITMTLAFVSIGKYSINKKISAFLFVFGFFYFDSLNVIRQYISLMIVVYGYMDLVEGRKKRFSFLVLIASLFHYSALINFIMIPLNKLNLNRKKVSIIYLIIFTFNLFYNEGMSLIFRVISFLPSIASYTIYQELTNSVTSKPYDLIVYTAILLFSFFASEKLAVKYPQFNLLRNNLVIAILLKGFALNFKYIDRIALYFSIYIIFFLPIIIKEIPLKNKKLLEFLIMCLFVLYCGIKINAGQAGVLDYRFFWSK